MRKNASSAKEGTEDDPGVKEENAVAELPKRNVNKGDYGNDHEWIQRFFGESRGQSQKQEKIDQNVSPIIITAAQGSHVWLEYSLDKQCHSAE